MATEMIYDFKKESKMNINIKFNVPFFSKKKKSHNLKNLPCFIITVQIFGLQWDTLGLRYLLCGCGLNV